MAFDFPSSSLTVGQIVTGPNGIQFQWDGTKWEAAGFPVGGPYLPLVGGTLTGALNISPASGAAPLNLHVAASGSANQLTGSVGSNYRWSINLGDGAPETGSDTGSNFLIARFHDSGVFIDDPLTINRATAAAVFGGALTVTGILPPYNTPPATFGMSLLIKPTDATQASQIRFDGASGVNKGFWTFTNGNPRWAVVANSNSESGSNAGSDFGIYPFTDAGVGGAYGASILITRSNYYITFNTGAGNNFLFNAGVFQQNCPAGTWPTINQNKTNATDGNNIVGERQGNARWSLSLGNTNNETGSNSGSDFGVYNYQDNGTYIGNPFAITRSNGAASFNYTLYVANTLTANGLLQCNQLSCGAGGANFSSAIYAQQGSGQNNCVIGYYQGGAWYNAMTAGCNVSGTQAVLFYNNGGNYMTWTTVNSDRRLKSNFKPAGDALDIVKSLLVYDLDYNAGIKSSKIGDRAKGEEWMPDSETEHWPFSLIADEVAAVMPHAAMKMTEEDGDHWVGLHAQHLVATLWKAVQQLTEQNDAMTARIAALEARA